MKLSNDLKENQRISVALQRGSTDKPLAHPSGHRLASKTKIA
jgi:hypothetical protein